MSQHALRLHGRRQLHNHRVAHVLAPTPNINTTCIAPRHTAPACTPYSGYCPTGSTKSTTTRASSPSPCWTWPQKLDSRSFSSEPARNRRIGSVPCSPSLAPKQHPTLPPPRPSSRPSLPPPPVASDSGVVVPAEATAAVAVAAAAAAHVDFQSPGPIRKEKRTGGRCVCVRVVMPVCVSCHRA